MKSKILFIAALVVLIACVFTGCRKLGSAAESTVSGIVSKVESDTKNLGSEVSNLVSNVESKVS